MLWTCTGCLQWILLLAVLLPPIKSSYKDLSADVKLFTRSQTSESHLWENLGAAGAPRSPLSITTPWSRDCTLVHGDLQMRIHGNTHKKSLCVVNPNVTKLGAGYNFRAWLLSEEWLDKVNTPTPNSNFSIFLAKFCISRGRTYKGIFRPFSAHFAGLREQKEHCSSCSLLPRSPHPIKSPLALPHAGSGILNGHSPEGWTNSPLNTPKTLSPPWWDKSQKAKCWPEIFPSTSIKQTATAIPLKLHRVWELLSWE